MNNNLNELMELKNYVNNLIEMVLSEEEKQKELKQIPRAYTNDPLGIKNKHNNPYIDEIIRKTDNTTRVAPEIKPATDKLISNASNYGQFGMKNIQKVNDRDPVLKQFKHMDNMGEKDPILNNMTKKTGDKLQKSFTKGENQITTDLQKKAIDWEQDRAFNKPINGPIPLKTTNLDKMTPEYMRDSTNLLSQKAKAKQHDEMISKLQKDRAFDERNNNYNSSLKGRIDNLGRGIRNKAQAVHDELSSIDHDAPAFAAGAAGVAGLGLAGYAAYKLAKKRKAEKEKANKK